MALIPAKCTQCGANIEVDASHEAGICKFCGTAFITEKAINNYNIQHATIINPGKNTDNLKKLGNDEYKKGNYSKAYDYFSEVLEINSDDAECIFKRNLIDQLNNSSDSLEYTYLPKLLSDYYNALCKSDLSDQEKSDVLVEASGECECVVTRYYYNQKGKTFTKGKIITNKYANFLLASRYTSWGMRNLAEFELSILEKFPKLESCILSQCNFAISVLQDETRKYTDANNSYACYTLQGDFADVCYNTASEISALKNKIVPYSLPSCLISPSAGGTGAEKNGCYIATCVYGSYDCPEVWTLRRFRDYTLEETWYGRLFIKCYYAISPTIVKWFGNADWFKTFWKKKLDKMVSDLNSKGIEDTSYTDKY